MLGFMEARRHLVVLAAFRAVMLSSLSSIEVDRVAPLATQFYQKLIIPYRLQPMRFSFYFDNGIHRVNLRSDSLDKLSMAHRWQVLQYPNL